MCSVSKPVDVLVLPCCLHCAPCCQHACLPAQLRTALALATVLNRTLILPPLWCGLDRYWAPHAGTLPGSTFKLPFMCPADHVLDLESKHTTRVGMHAG